MRKMDPLGNKVGTTDEYGNPIHGHGTAGHDGLHHTGGYGAGQGTGAQQLHAGGGAPGVLHAGGGAPGVLRRSGSSSSSSSSEDDGLGGRRKKGIKDKFKDKLPGGHKNEQIPQQHYDQGVAAGGLTQETEKKGLMDKIKEKLPGSHNN